MSPLTLLDNHQASTGVLFKQYNYTKHCSGLAAAGDISPPPPHTPATPTCLVPKAATDGVRGDHTRIATQDVKCHIDVSCYDCLDVRQLQCLLGEGLELCCPVPWPFRRVDDPLSQAVAANLIPAARAHGTGAGASLCREESINWLHWLVRDDTLAYTHWS
jgi:hypothetical protein